MNGRRARERRREFVPSFMSRQVSPRQAIEDALARPGSQLFPVSVPEGARPAEDVPQAWPQEEDPNVPHPSFTPNPLPSMTAPQPAIRRPYVGGMGPRPVIYDAVAATVPVSPLSPPPPPPVPGAAPALYCGPGWASALMRMRLRNGEWEELPRTVDASMGRNAAEAVTALRHARSGIAEAARQYCSGIGRPDLLDDLLDRVSELNAAGGAR